MRRIILKPGEIFSEDQLQRVGAFDAHALTAATEIIEAVRTQGDAALRAYTKQFDGVEIENFHVSDTAIDEAITRVDPEVSQALRQAAKQIRDFHERQKQQSWFTIREDGALVGAKVEPLDSVGIYVPGGRALYPSSVLMNAIPAAVAGVKRIVCVTPPTKDGSLDPAILEACRHRRRDRDLFRWWRASYRRAGLRNRKHPEGRKDHRSRQCVRGRSEEDRLGRCRYRHDRWSFRGVRAC